MNLSFAPRGILQIENAVICFKNFSGEGSAYNRPGDRNFSLVINDSQVMNPNTNEVEHMAASEVAQLLIDEGWNVKIKAPREEGDEPFYHMNVKVKYTENSSPRAYLISGETASKLDESTIGLLDHIAIQNIDMDIRPYDYDFNGMQGRSAYLQAIGVTQYMDRFEERYNSMNGNNEA